MPTNVKISQLPVVTTLGPTDVLPVVASGVTSQISEANLATVIAQSITGSEVVSISGSSLYSNGSFLVNTSGFSTTNGLFLGYQAGYNAANAYHTNYLGYQAGYQATNAYNSNFIGIYAGQNSTNANESNFIGDSAGNYAINASRSNFIGNAAGTYATNASQSNFIGWQAGDAAANAAGSTFIGQSAGYLAVSASSSTFIGNFAGYYAASASYSTIIGWNAGMTQTYASVGSNNIIIGTAISLPAGYSNGINIGGLIFGSGSNGPAGFSGTPSTSAANGFVGINQPNPAYSLDVSGSIHLSQALLLQPQVPLPTGTTGSLAASGSHLYFYNGTSSNAGWAQVI